MRLEMYGHQIGLSEAARFHIASRVEFALGRLGRGSPGCGSSWLT